MTLPLLVQPAELDALVRAVPRRVAVLDCSFDLVNPAAGRRAHEAAHVPGARHVDLEADLSGAKTGRNGRHPLPERSDFAVRMRSFGLDDDTPVVAYDNAGGMYAARLWWMLRWAGHADVAVLDGGLAAWKAAGLEVAAGPAAVVPVGRFSLRPSLTAAVDRQALLDNLRHPARLVVDARAADRFRGENETLDPVGGRIPGAVNRFYRDNLGPDGRFKPASQLRADYEAVAAGRAPASLVMQCGSGVTACHNLLALEVAGLPGAALYPGSWSEWSAWPDAPIATGPAT
jgi:thiosulfate/3-mercaptopyruvate sulfurtransferase